MDQFTVQTREEYEEQLDKRRKEVFADASVAALKEAKFACDLEIDYGKLEIGHLVGRIPMFSFDPKPSFEHLPEAEEMLRKIAIEAKMLIPKSRLYGEKSVVRTSIICAMYSDPKQDPRNMHVILIASFILSLYYLDDEMCGDLVFPSVIESEGIIDSWADTMTGLLHGRYKTYEEIPPAPATFEAVVRLIWLIKCKFGSLLPPDACMPECIRERTKAALQAMISMRIEAVGHKCSEELFRSLRGEDAGVPLLIEIMIAGAEADGKKPVEPEIRKHILFKKLIELSGQEAGLTNDLVGFIKEMDGNEVYYNYILRTVELEEMSFHDAFHKTIKLITRLRKDILILTDQLQDEFPESDALGELVILIKQLLDANVYVSSIAPRYGGMKIREVPLEE